MKIFTKNTVLQNNKIQSGHTFQEACPVKLNKSVVIENSHASLESSYDKKKPFGVLRT